MKTKKFIKIILDIIMTLLLVLMYKKNVINLTFHEIGGLVLCGLFLIHKGLNFKWIVKISQKIFTKKLTVKARLQYSIDLLLLLSLTFVAVSGIFISETILTSISSDNIIWRVAHLFASALALILVGIHLGLHWGFIKNIFKKVIRIPKILQKPLTALCITAILFFGGYSTINSNFTKFLLAPFTVSYISAPSGPTFEQSANQGGTEKAKEISGESGKGNGKGDSTGKGLHKGQGKGKGYEPSLLNTIEIMSGYFAITLMFAIIAYWFEKFFKIKKPVKNRTK
jgi:hypothetical protein